MKRELAIAEEAILVDVGDVGGFFAGVRVDDATTVGQFAAADTLAQAHLIVDVHAAAERQHTVL